MRKPTARKNGRSSSRVTLDSSSSAVEAICVSWKRSVSSTLHHDQLGNKMHEIFDAAP